MSLRLCVVLVACVVAALFVGGNGGVSAAAIDVHAGDAAPKFVGYIISAQYTCDDFECPDWELDISKVDPMFALPPTQRLETLLPKASISQMDFPVWTAFDNTTRQIYVLANRDTTTGNLWVSRLSNDANSTRRLNTSTVKFDSTQGDIVGFHVTKNNTVLILFKSGLLASISVTGVITPIFNILPATTYTYGQALTASAYNGDADELYVFICDQYRDNIAVERIVLRTLATTVNPFTTHPRDRLGPETFMHGVWCPTTKSFVVFMMGTNLGFDQIVSIDVTTGEGKFLAYDLAENNIAFQCVDSTKTCDALQTSTYDYTQNRIYFQATQFQGVDDDIGETVLVYLDMNYPTHPYIDVGLAPFSFGYMDFTWVPIIA